ncbi:hypothetical protein LTR86_002245 [Recurvomyces mirabilis]|nr:hypothetical protein LTR86_002245 [Recurvomyces mirabilis]
MPSEASASLPGAANPICEHCGTNTGLERIDGTKVNDLVDSLRERLSRDVHGNFFLEGAKTGKDTRHGQLGDLFSLLANLEGFKTAMDKYIALHAPKEVVKPEKPVTINQNLTPVVEAMIERLTSNRFRDLSIRCERLEEEQRATKAGHLATAAVSKKRAARIDFSQVASFEKCDLSRSGDAWGPDHGTRIYPGQHPQDTHRESRAGHTISEEIQNEDKATIVALIRSVQKLEQQMSDVLCHQMENKSVSEAVADIRVDTDEMRNALIKLEGWQSGMKLWQDTVSAQLKEVSEMGSALMNLEKGYASVKRGQQDTLFQAQATDEIVGDLQSRLELMDLQEIYEAQAHMRSDIELLFGSRGHGKNQLRRLWRREARAGLDATFWR